MATHYETLGVSPEATTAEIRRAYVERARALHPDRTQGDDRRMQEVNEAWRVLRDPGSRRAYDLSLRAVPPPVPEVDPLDVPFPSAPADPGDVGVAIIRALPWVAILVVLAVIFVATALAGGSKGGDETEELLGHCIVSGAASTITVVPCTEPNEGKVELVVDRASYCPDGSEGRALGDDRWLCLSEVPR